MNLIKKQSKINKLLSGYENLYALEVQLLNSVIDVQPLCGVRVQNLVNSPKYQILGAIYAFIRADIELCDQRIKKYNSINSKFFTSLAPGDKVFCVAFQAFLSKLVEQFSEKPSISNVNNLVYHLGESHCLSYSNQNIKINGRDHKVLPMITFGGKAFHFSQNRKNEFKAITMANLQAIPVKSEVFISFGEIDCRLNEGFLLAAEKQKKSLQDLITDTVTGYLKWFSDQNESSGHNLNIFNVPAPLFDEELSREVNLKVAEVVSIFNKTLSDNIDFYGFKLIDTFCFTSNENGFSNKIFHIDKRHLNSKAIKEIEKQFTFK